MCHLELVSYVIQYDKIVFLVHYGVLIHLFAFTPIQHPFC